MGWTRRDFAETFHRMLRDRYVEIGKEVRRLRENQGLSQEELAYKAGVSYKTISRMESPPTAGPHATRGSTFRRVADALGVTVEHLRAPLNQAATISTSQGEVPAGQGLEGPAPENPDKALEPGTQDESASGTDG